MVEAARKLATAKDLLEERAGRFEILAGELVEKAALGHRSATLVGHADGGLVCWATAVLHSRMVQGIALVSSPHPAALRHSVQTCREQGRALLPTLLRYQVPRWPEHLLKPDIP